MIQLIKRVINYYNSRQIPLASAALCYYMTMSVFPLIICLYTLLGKNYDRAMSILRFAEELLSRDAVETIRTFLAYVANNHSQAMFYAGMLLMLTSASAGLRSLQITVGRMQGGPRYTGVSMFFFSLLFSVVFLVATWFAILVMFSSKELLERILVLLEEHVPSVRMIWIDFDSSLLRFRYFMLAGIMFLMLWGIYRFSRKRHLRYATWPGAILATIGTVGMSLIFSAFIAASARYPLVYGSLASVILLMYWMYLSCQVIYIGAAFNLSLRDVKQKKQSQTEQRQMEKRRS